MNKNDLKRFSSVIWALAEDFGGKISKDSLQLRFEALKSYSINQISQAGTWLLKNREQTFPAVPTTSEIIKAIEKTENPEAVSSEAMAEIQLQLVLDKLRSDGATGVVNFDDPTTQELMTKRWPYNQWASTVLEADIKWFCKEFKELYKTYDKNKVIDLGLLEAPGAKTNQIPASKLKELL